jgi:hypothetical protein
MQRPGRTLSPIARLVTAGALALAAAVAGAGTASAYPSPGNTSTLWSCRSVSLGRSCLLLFTLVDAHGHPVQGTSVSFAISNLTGGSFSGRATTNGFGIAIATYDTGSAQGNCGRTGTITATAGGSTAQTQITVTCSSGTAWGPDPIFTSILGSIITGLSGGVIDGSSGGSTYNLTVPPGVLPPGVEIKVLAADTAQLASLLPSQAGLLSAVDVEWPINVTSSSPVTLVIHNPAFQPGNQVYEVVGNSLSRYQNATVGAGVATITFSGDPAFAVLASSTVVPSGLGNEGAMAATVASPPAIGAYAVATAALLVLTLLAVPLVRRRRCA